MKNTDNQNRDSKKIFTLIVLIATLMVCETGATFAYFALSASNNGATGTAATSSLTLTVTQATLKSGNTGVMVPQLESSLGTAMNGTNKCGDANNNIVCKVYTITVTNGSTAAVKVYGTIQFDNANNMPNLKWRKTTNATTLGSLTSVAISQINSSQVTTAYSGVSGNLNKSEVYDLESGGVCKEPTIYTSGAYAGCTSVSLAKTGASGNAKTYYIVVWINETGSVQADTGTWRATVRFEGENGTGITSTIT